MLEIFKKLRGNANPTAAELRKALEQIDVASLEGEVQAAEAARRAALVGGDEKGLAAAEKALHAARIALERASIARDELAARVSAAEAAEAVAALDRERAEVEAFAAETAAAIAKRWPALQREMVELLARLSAAEARVQALNERLVDAGRSDLVAAVEFGRARPRPEVIWEGGIALAATVVLPPIPEWDVPGHGEVRALPAFWSKPATAGDYIREHDRPKPLVL